MRATLSLFALDRPALIELSKELKSTLLSDDRAALAKLLELGGSLADRVTEGPRAVDWFLRPEADSAAAPLFASLRRVAKKRALSLAWTSPHASLEGRLRAFDVLREDKNIADLLDKLLDPNRLPWFLVRPGATCGWLDDEKRGRLASLLRPLRAALPDEVVEFANAAREVDGAVVIHDAL
ncbi:MAG: hypothetical protein HUU21_10815 [Polyangiaceae bacterium]|nr:hypothetical protein [Polyangiaceae bacterium]